MNFCGREKQVDHEKGGRVMTAVAGHEISAWLDLVRWIVREHKGLPRREERGRPLEINRMFLDALCGPGEGKFEELVTRLAREAEEDGEEKKTALFFLTALYEIPEEIGKCATNCAIFAENLKRSAAILREGRMLSHEEKADLCWSVFFPEGRAIYGRRKEAIEELRRMRRVSVMKPPESPIKDPFSEILITANALLTIPLHEGHNESLPEFLREPVRAASREEQRFWYDHPVPLGVPPENNEILYGLRGLDEAIAFEVKRARLGKDISVPCLLSVSVTHEGLHAVARDWIESELSRQPLRYLDLFVFTEADTNRLIEDVLLPAGERCCRSSAGESLKAAFGVDGEYGRHYTFLKAVTAIYSVMIDPHVRATFKIDLDQIFPQELLVHETGMSAFEHLASPLWGAVGLDVKGKEVELGMIAGALVNDRDIERSLFTPDVPFPEAPPRYDELIFFSPLTQALSTEAEMMTRYDGNFLDGKTKCLQRIHVTGGTTGILLESLMRYRPFTPSFIGRAEDQAWLLSVLFSGERRLRYLHQAGLFMRHDKESFAAEAVKKSALGKLVGDYARILLFSLYARLLPWSVEDIKEEVDPFTGCFISPIPVTLAVLRMSLKALRLRDEGAFDEADELIRLGSARLMPLIRKGAEESLRERYSSERDAWNYYYDIIEALEEALKKGDKEAVFLKEKTEEIFRSCRIENY